MKQIEGDENSERRKEINKQNKQTNKNRTKTTFESFKNHIMAHFSLD